MAIMRFAELGGVRIPIRAMVPRARQTFEGDEVAVQHRMGDGGLKTQALAGTVGKLRTELSGEGALPPGLDGLDFTVPLLLKSAAQRDIVSASNVIDIPSARRSDTDYTPFGRAYLDTPQMDTPVLTAVSMAGDQATLTPVGGATRYQVVWYPQFNVLAEGSLSKDEDLTGAVIRWRIRLRQT